MYSIFVAKEVATIPPWIRPWLLSSIDQYQCLLAEVCHTGLHCLLDNPALPMTAESIIIQYSVLCHSTAGVNEQP